MNEEFEKALAQLGKIYADFDDVSDVFIKMRSSDELELLKIYWAYNNADIAFAELLNAISNYRENHS